jgi:hypothetical protein
MDMVTEHGMVVELDAADETLEDLGLKEKPKAKDGMVFIGVADDNWEPWMKEIGTSFTREHAEELGLNVIEVERGKWDEYNRAKTLTARYEQSMIRRAFPVEVQAAH